MYFFFTNISVVLYTFYSVHTVEGYVEQKNKCFFI